MFDLWGEKVSTPLPVLDLKTVDTTAREKSDWEKELLGVPFSKQPFNYGKNELGTTLCGEIDAEMDGQAAAAIGEVATVAQLFTRRQEQFLKVTLEDISGSVDVMVWPKVYESSRELWEEGNILLVEGKVRLRDDRVQLNCDSVRHYQPEAAQGEEVVTPEPDEVPPATDEAPATTAQSKSHRLVINITQTNDKDSDIASLHKLISTLKDFSGKDEVTLSVKTEETTENLKLPGTNYCPELHQQLVELVGEEGFKVESFAT